MIRARVFAWQYRLLRFLLRSKPEPLRGDRVQPSVYELWERVRAHPDYVAGTIFTVDDLPDPAARERDAARRLEEAMTAAGFEAAENLGVRNDDDDEGTFVRAAMDAARERGFVR